MKRVLLPVLLIFAVAATVFSQAQMSSGDVKGVVMDASGAVVPGASVSATNTETGLQRHVTTDGLGAFRFLVLPPGTYELKVQAPGFAIYTRRPIFLTVGSTVLINPQLEAAGNQTEILVQAAMPVLETAKTQQADTITTERIQNLPINKRNFLAFSLLTPGVTDSDALVSYTLPQTPTSGLSFLGQSGRANNVTIDGVDNNDNAVASVRSTLSQEAVQEFQINRSNYSAEFGRAAGGLINIVSRSGTNQWNGSVFAFMRDQALDARNPFAFGEAGTPIDPPFSRVQAGFTAGGPIRRNRTFMFLSYEGLRQRESRFVSFMENTRFFQPTTSQRALLDAMRASPTVSLRALSGALETVLTTSEAVFPNTVKLLRSQSGVFPFRNNDNTASLRLDHTISSANQIFGRFSFSDIDTFGGAFGGLKAPSRGANYKIQDSSAMVGDSHVFGSRAVNEFRFQFANRDFDALPADAFGPEININGVAFLGRDFFLPSTRNEKRYQALDNFTLVKGRHQLKFGGDFNYIPFDTVTEVFLGGRFIFGEQIPLGSIIDNLTGSGNAVGIATSFIAAGRPDLAAAVAAPISALQSFNLGLPLVYQQGFGNPRAKLTNKLISGYIQDTARFGQNLTVNLGLRYDVELQPTPIHRDKNNWGPRFGFSYTPDQRTVIRGGYGIYYTPLFEAVAFVGRVLDGTQISQIFVPLRGLPELGIRATSAQVWALAAPAIGNRTLTAADIAQLGLQPGTTPPVLLGANAQIVNPYSQQMSLGFDRAIPGSINLSVSYLGNRGVKLIRARNVNLRQIGTNVYGPLLGAIDPRILQRSEAESSASSIYHGMALSATKSYNSSYQFQVSYTLSKAIDDSTDFITDLAPANPLNLRGERGLSSFDQRHRLVVSGLLTAPFEQGVGLGKVFSGTTVAPIFTYSSGHPFNLLLGFDANGDTNANTDRPSGAGRNTGTGPDFVSFDVRIAREIHFSEDYSVEGIFEAFNLFNRTNFSGLNNTVGTTPLATYRVKGRRDVGPTDPLGFTSAFDPRQIQLGLKFRF